MTQLSYEAIPIHDSGEPLVDLAAYPFIVEAVYFDQGISDDPIVRVRQGVAERLVEAQAALGNGYRFKIWDGYRPRDVQAALFDALRCQIAHERPALSETELDHATQAFITTAADPERIPPHATGGTVDLTLVDRVGNELNMGTPFDFFGPEASPLYFETPGTDTTIRDNRRRLFSAMAEAGFTVHEDEWWHFDYGNQAWAARSGQPAAIYAEAFVS